MAFEMIPSLPEKPKPLESLENGGKIIFRHIRGGLQKTKKALCLCIERARCA